MGSTEIDLYCIAYVKVDFIPVPKMCILSTLGRFAWTTRFVLQCDYTSLERCENLKLMRYFLKPGQISISAKMILYFCLIFSNRPLDSYLRSNPYPTKCESFHFSYICSKYSQELTLIDYSQGIFCWRNFDSACLSFFV